MSNPSEDEVLPVESAEPCGGAGSGTPCEGTDTGTPCGGAGSDSCASAITDIPEALAYLANLDNSHGAPIAPTKQLRGLDRKGKCAILKPKFDSDGVPINRDLAHIVNKMLPGKTRNRLTRIAAQIYAEAESDAEAEAKKKADAEVAIFKATDSGIKLKYYLRAFRAVLDDSSLATDDSRIKRLINQLFQIAQKYPNVNISPITSRDRDQLITLFSSYPRKRHVRGTWDALASFEENAAHRRNFLKVYMTTPRSTRPAWAPEDVKRHLEVHDTSADERRSALEATPWDNGSHEDSSSNPFSVIPVRGINFQVVYIHQRKHGLVLVAESIIYANAPVLDAYHQMSLFGSSCLDGRPACNTSGHTSWERAFMALAYEAIAEPVVTIRILASNESILGFVRDAPLPASLSYFHLLAGFIENEFAYVVSVLRFWLPNFTHFKEMIKGCLGVPLNNEYVPFIGKIIESGILTVPPRSHKWYFLAFSLIGTLPVSSNGSGSAKVPVIISAYNLLEMWYKAPSDAAFKKLLNVREDASTKGVPTTAPKAGAVNQAPRELKDATFSAMKKDAMRTIVPGVIVCGTLLQQMPHERLARRDAIGTLSDLLEYVKVFLSVIIEVYLPDVGRVMAFEESSLCSAEITQNGFLYGIYTAPGSLEPIGFPHDCFVKMHSIINVREFTPGTGVCFIPAKSLCTPRVLTKNCHDGFIAASHRNHESVFKSLRTNPDYVADLGDGKNHACGLFYNIDSRIEDPINIRVDGREFKIFQW